MTQQEYWDEIRSLAEWLSDNRPAELGGEGVTADYGEDADRYDAMHETLAGLHETLDGHEFVIYTHKARQVAVHSDNPDRMMDELGGDAGGEMFDERRAYYAMEQDIIDRGGMEERFDLDELRTERFESITGGDEFAQWVRDAVEEARLPNWSSALVTECHEVEGQDLTLEWMPNNSADVQTVTVTDEHCNQVVIQISNRKAA